jgi:preprotein translocase subunit SecG
MLMNLLIGTLLTLHVLTCVLLITVVLMQRSKQEGLGAAFGGGITDSVFGAQTSTILTKATTILTIAFFSLSIALAYLYAHRTANSPIQKQLTAPAAPTPAPAPAAAAPATTAPATAPTPAPVAPAKP